MATHERITSQSLPQAPYVYAISNAWRGGKCILNAMIWYLKIHTASHGNFFFAEKIVAFLDWDGNAIEPLVFAEYLHNLRYSSLKISRFDVYTSSIDWLLYNLVSVYFIIRRDKNLYFQFVKRRKKWIVQWRPILFYD